MPEGRSERLERREWGAQRARPAAGYNAPRRGRSAAVGARARPVGARKGLIYGALPTHEVLGTHRGAQRAVGGRCIAQVRQRGAHRIATSATQPRQSGARASLAPDAPHGCPLRVSGAPGARACAHFAAGEATRGVTGRGVAAVRAKRRHLAPAGLERPTYDCSCHQQAACAPAWQHEGRRCARALGRDDLAWPRAPARRAAVPQVTSHQQRA